MDDCEHLDGEPIIELADDGIHEYDAGERFFCNFVSVHEYCPYTNRVCVLKCADCGELIDEPLCTPYCSTCFENRELKKEMQPSQVVE